MFIMQPSDKAEAKALAQKENTIPTFKKHANTKEVKNTIAQLDKSLLNTLEKNGKLGVSLWVIFTWFSFYSLYTANQSIHKNVQYIQHQSASNTYNQNTKDRHLVKYMTSSVESAPERVYTKTILNTLSNTEKLTLPLMIRQVYVDEINREHQNLEIISTQGFPSTLEYGFIYLKFKNDSTNSQYIVNIYNTGATIYKEGKKMGELKNEKELKELQESKMVQ